MSTIDTRITEILAKLARVKRGFYRSFGSEAHGFRLNRPLAEEPVAAFELQHAVTLPQDYRRFLTVAGNGGAGPFYGILPLERWDTAMAVPGTLSRPSLLRPGMRADLRWEEALGCDEEELFDGVLSLNHHGCTYYGLLIVSGEYRGRVVYVDADAALVPHFVAQDDFLSWYERWLDDLLSGKDVTAFGYGSSGTVA